MPKIYKHQQLVDKAYQWGYDRGLHKMNGVGQPIKLMEEFHELAEAILVEDELEIMDAIGDMQVVVITHHAQLYAEPYQVQLENLQPSLVLEDEMNYLGKMVIELYSLKNTLDPIDRDKVDKVHREIFKSLEIIALLNDMTIEGCLEYAVNEIWDRTGKIDPESETYVKDE